MAHKGLCRINILPITHFLPHICMLIQIHTSQLRCVLWRKIIYKHTWHPFSRHNWQYLWFLKTIFAFHFYPWFPWSEWFPFIKPQLDTCQSNYSWEVITAAAIVSVGTQPAVTRCASVVWESCTTAHTLKTNHWNKLTTPFIFTISTASKLIGSMTGLFWMQDSVGCVRVIKYTINSHFCSATQRDSVNKKRVPCLWWLTV